VGNPLAGDPIWEASSAFELRIAITTKQVSRAGHPSDLLVARSATRRPRPASRAAAGPQETGTTCSQPIQESEERVWGAIAAGPAVQWRGAGQCSLFERESA
jgi:hypothetical protein